MNDFDTVSAANTEFGFRLLRLLVKAEPTGNIFFSPFSLSLALSMTLNGTEGRTAKDLAAALGLADLPLGQINEANARLLSSLTAPDLEVTVKIANALWANRSVTLNPAFQDRCRDYYAARTGPLESAAAINEWVGANTDGKIKGLVSDADILGAMLVLTNALYFRGLWQTGFRKSDTRPMPFHLSEGVEKSVPFMCRSGRFSYAETALGQTVSLPYGDGRMRLIALLPPPSQTADVLIQSLDLETWTALTAQLKPTEVTLFLPRFKAEYAARLREPLSALGMASAFAHGRDFLPMGLSDAFIGDVIHKATLDVDEEGTVAAAATAVVMRGRAAFPSLVMCVDRPFFLGIWDDAAKTLLFAGVIRDPG